MYKRIIHFFVLSCQKATFLIEKQLHTSLSLLEKLQLRIHLSICKSCTSYKHKATFLNQLMGDAPMKDEAPENTNYFSEDEVAGLKEKIKGVVKLDEP